MELRRFAAGRRWVAWLLVAALALPLGMEAARSSVGSDYVEDSSPTTLALGASGTEIVLDGELDDGIAARFAALLDAHPEVRRLRLTSEGGYVYEAEAIGALVASRGLVTVVSDYCLSACTLAFAHGRERLLSRGAKLGFHAPYETDASGAEVAIDSSSELQAYAATGIDTAFVEEALRVPFTDIWFPDPSRLIDSRVVTALIDPDAGRR